MNFEERVLPELKEGLSALPPFELTNETLPIIRETVPTLLPPTVIPDTISVREVYIPNSEGEKNLLVKIYEPKAKKGKLPAMLFIQGGGMVFGYLAMSDRICIQFAEGANCIVVSVDYRLAPEHPYPTPLEDCYSALVWMSKEADALGIDSTKIATAGQSAGGGLCAGLSLLARDRKGPSICFQMPLYPMLDNRSITSSSKAITDERVWNVSKNKFGWDSYLGGTADKDVSIYASPARAKDLRGLPPTYMMVGELDLFRDEDINYVRGLLEAEVPTEFHIYPGCFHAFDLFLPDTNISKFATAAFVDAMKKALN
jgi:acetyl esterase/lipase